MAIVRNSIIKVGDWVKPKRNLVNFGGKIEKGTPCRVIGIGERGYDVVATDEQGEFRCTECGWDFSLIKK